MKITSITNQEWDEFLKSTPYSIFNTSKWNDTLSNNSVKYFVLRDKNGCIMCGLPVHEKRLLNLRVMIPLPLTPYDGLLFNEKWLSTLSRTSKYSRIKQFTSETIRFLKSKYSLIAVKFPFDYLDFQPFIWSGFDVNVTYTYILRKSPLEQIWRGFDSKRRNDIKRAERDGLKVVKTNKEKDILKSLVKKTFERQRKSFDLTLIDRVFKATNDKMNFIVYKNTIPISALCIVWDKSTAYYLLGGYDHSNSHSGAQALAAWEAIKYTFEELRLDYFDFEGSMVSNVEKFFREFGGELVKEYNVVYYKSKIVRFLVELSKKSETIKKVRKFVLKH